MVQEGTGPAPARISTREDFARELTALRERAGLTVRQVAAQAGSPGAHSTIGDWFAGRGLPSLALKDVFVRVLQACGVTTAEETARWMDAWQRVRRTRARRTGGAEPYRGLASFQVEHAEWFFGRDTLTRLLLDRVDELAGGGMLLVVGASGAGKSSLLRAGMIAHLHAQGRVVTRCTPAERPALQGRAGEIIVVDQFEEVFTEFTGRSERAVFVESLTRAAAEGSVVVIGLRADFYGHALRFPRLAAAAQDCQVAVGPMNREELRTVIVEPARKAGLAVEDGLVELLLREAGRAHDTGVLPLLSHALYATWLHDQSRGLTVAGYQEAGGIEGAVATSATEVYESLDPQQRELARWLFLHLVHVSTDAADTRRRVPLADLLAGGPAMAEVLDRFVGQRLVTLDQDTVEITHEALLSAWPLLAEWLQADRADLLTGRKLAADAQAWRNERHDPDALYRGARLLAAQEWADRHPGELTRVAADFLLAGGRQSRRRTRRLYQTITALVVLVVLAAGAALVASQAQRTATRQRDEALSRRLAGDAIALRATNPALSAQLGLAAYRLAATPEARGSVLAAPAVPYATRLTGHSAAAYVAVFSPDGRVLVTGGTDRTLRLWDVSTVLRPRHLTVLRGHTGDVLSAAFRPGSRILATAGADRTTRLWDLNDPLRPRALAVLEGHTDNVRTVAFHPGGRILATAGYDRTVRLWDVSTPTRPRRLATLSGPPEQFTSATFQPGGRILVATTADAVVRVWDIGDPRRPRKLPHLSGHTDRVLCAAFSPDGRTLATSGFDNTIRLWDLRVPRRARPIATLQGHQSGVVSLAFAPDGRRLASASYDRTARLWDITDPALPGEPLTLRGHSDVVYGAAFSPDGHTLASAGKDTTIRLWDTRAGVLSGHYSPVMSLAASPDGRVLVAGSYLSARVWDIATRAAPELAATLKGHTDNVTAAAFAPAGRILATGSLDRTVRLWDLSDPRRPRGLGLITGHRDNVAALAFGPGGLLATAGADATARLWRVADPRRPVALTTMAGHAGSVDAVAFSADGGLLATGGDDSTVRLWRITDPRRPVPVSTLKGHANAVTRTAFSPDGRMLASAGLDGSVRLWSLTAPRNPRLVAALTGHADAVIGATFSPDGRMLASASLDGSVRLWGLTDPRNPAVIATMTGHDGRIQALAYIPGSHTVATGGEDTTVRLWDTDVEHAAAKICAHAHPALSIVEWAAYLPSDLPFRRPC